MIAELGDEEELTQPPPPIVGFSEKEKEVRVLIEAIKHKLDDEGKSLLLMLLKKWGPFYILFTR